MEVSQLYQFVLMIVLVGMLLGVGVLVLDAFSRSTGVTTTVAGVTLNQSRDALTPIATTWMPLIVTVSVLAIILSLVIGSFAGQRR
jgi:hypothetical protein